MRDISRAVILIAAPQLATAKDKPAKCQNGSSISGCEQVPGALSARDERFGGPREVAERVELVMLVWTVSVLLVAFLLGPNAASSAASVVDPREAVQLLVSTAQHPFADKIIVQLKF